MKYNYLYNSFSAGEISRLLKGRTDIEEYFKGLEDCENFIPMPQGGVTFRPGTWIDTRFPYTESDVPYTLRSFTPDDNNSYIVFLNFTPTASTDQIRILNLANNTLATITKSTYIFNSRPDFTSASTAIGGSDLSPVNANRILFLQQGDVFIILDKDGVFAPIVGKRTGTDAFTVDSMILPLQGNGAGLITIDNFFRYQLVTPYKDKNINNNVRLKVSATTGTVTLSAENAAAAAIPYFTGDVVGMLVRITHAAVTGVARITAKASDSSCTALVLTTFGATTASTNFECSMWNPADGYPRSGCFFEGRLFLGGNIKYPDMVWASNSGNIFHFMQTRLAQDSTTDVSGVLFFGAAKDTDPFNFIPASEAANKIQWMLGLDQILIGTTKTEYAVSGTDDSAMSPTSIRVKPISNYGSNNVQPVRAGSSILFCSNDGRRVYEIPSDTRQYDTAVNLMVSAEGILDRTTEDYLPGSFSYNFSTSIINMVYVDAESVLYVHCRNNASERSYIVTLTKDKVTKTNAWARQYIKGPNDTTLSIYGMCVLPDSALINKHTLFFYAQAPNSGYVLVRMAHSPKTDKMADTANPTLEYKQYNHLDCSYIYGDSNFNLDDLNLISEHKSILNEGDILSVVAGGEYVGDFEYKLGVGIGYITIPDASTYDAPFIVGFKYTGKIKTFPIEAGAQWGTSTGSARRGHEMSVFLDRSRGGVYKQSQSANEYPLETLATFDALSTKEFKLSLNANPYDYQTQIRQTEPYPLTILWLLIKGVTND